MGNENLALRAYASARATTRTPRAIEYEALAGITQRLEASDAISGFSEMARVLHDNRKIWSIFAADIANPGNRLPPELKAGIFSLAAFVSQETSKILSRRGDIVVLVEINLSMLRGLRGELA